MQKKYFESLPDDAKARIFEHIKEHETALAKLMASAQAMGAPQMPQQGGTPQMPQMPQGGAPQMG
jgi:hypothetical protein